jgi:hypothetical protein
VPSAECDGRDPRSGLGHGDVAPYGEHRSRLGFSLRVQEPEVRCVDERVLIVAKARVAELVDAPDREPKRDRGRNVTHRSSAAESRDELSAGGETVSVETMRGDHRIDRREHVVGFVGRERAHDMTSNGARDDPEAERAQEVLARRPSPDAVPLEVHVARRFARERPSRVLHDDVRRTKLEELLESAGPGLFGNHEDHVVRRHEVRRARELGTERARAIREPWLERDCERPEERVYGFDMRAVDVSRSVDASGSGSESDIDRCATEAPLGRTATLATIAIGFIELVV